MKRWLLFFAILAVLFAVSFALSLWVFPSWLKQSGWVLQLTGMIILAGLSVIGSEIISKALSFLFEDKEFNERLSFVFGNKYQNISKKLDEFTEQEIAKEIKSRKYIPNIFIETTDIKEKLRYFAEPHAFLQKIIEQTDRELRSSYIVSALKQVHFPVEEESFKNVKLKAGDQESLKKTILEYRAHLDKRLALMDVLVKGNGVGLKPEFKSKIPTEYSHIHDYMSPNLQFYWSYEHVIENARLDLGLLQGNLLIIKSLAGHGKTNLICDFTKKFLVRKRHKCLYFSAKSLNHLGEQETIEQAITRAIFADSDVQFADIFRLAKFDKKIDFLFILIDGINEHKNLQLFADALEQFIQRCNGHNIKIILTCRSEYFDERFGNLLRSDNCSVIDMDQRRHISEIPDVHTEALVSGYFSEFKIKMLTGQIYPEVMDVFNKDKLLLRIFCEAYENEKPGEYLRDLYKLEIFNKYYEKMIGTIQGLDSCLGEIIDKMLSDHQFTNVRIDQLSNDAARVVEATVYENVIIKKDVLINPDLAFGRSEVINFVYDEFRDFLIASKILLTWDQDRPLSVEMIQNLAAPKTQVAEGLQRYLCLWSIKNKKKELIEYLASQEWFDKNFIASVFETPDALLSDYVIDRVKMLFVANPTNARRVILRSVRRANTGIYPNLNIELLFSWFDKFNDDEYERVVVGALGKEYNFESAYVTYLCQDILDAFREKRISDASQKNVIKLLAYCVGVEDYSYLRVPYSELGKQPASEVLYILTEEVSSDLMRDALTEVIQSSNATMVKDELRMIVDLTGEA